MEPRPEILGPEKNMVRRRGTYGPRSRGFPRGERGRGSRDGRSGSPESRLEWRSFSEGTGLISHGRRRGTNKGRSVNCGRCEQNKKTNGQVGEHTEGCDSTITGLLSSDKTDLGVVDLSPDRVSSTSHL